MGAATRRAQERMGDVLTNATGVDLAVTEQLFQAAQALSEAPQLCAALADHFSAVEARKKIISDVFETAASEATVSLINSLVEQAWSSPRDLVSGLEELAVRSAAVADSSDIEYELFEVSRVLDQQPELELALGYRLVDGSARQKLVDEIFAQKVGAATLVILHALVRQNQRRIHAALVWAMRVIAAQRSRSVATVTTALPLTKKQNEKIANFLSAKYGAAVAINIVIDPDIIGGLRVQIGDQIIDASVSSRFEHLRQKLAG